MRATRYVKRGGASALVCGWESFSWMDYLLSFDVSWPHLTGAEHRSAFCITSFFPSPSKRKKNHHPAPEGAPVSAWSAAAPRAPCFMHHRFNKHRQHPRRSPLPILPAEGAKLFPLLSSLPNPRLYQLSIKKIQLQFGIRQNTLITKGWCNLITWYLFRGLSRGSWIEGGEEGKNKM